MAAAFDFHNAYALDKSSVNTGTLITHPASGIKFRIARAGNRAYTSAVQAGYKKNEKQLAIADSDKASVEAVEAARDLGEKLLNEIRANTILTGWEGTVPFGGKQLAYSKENAVTLLELEEFSLWVNQESANIDNYRVTVTDEELKN